MYLPDCYSMGSTTLSNYYLIDWWRNFDFCLFVCWIDIRFCYSYMTWETGGLELASTIILVLQASRLTRCASHPVSNFALTCGHERNICYLWQALVLMWNSALLPNWSPTMLSVKSFGYYSWGNSYMPCLLLIITLLFTCGERNIW